MDGNFDSYRLKLFKIKEKIRAKRKTMYKYLHAYSYPNQAIKTKTLFLFCSSASTHKKQLHYEKCPTLRDPAFSRHEPYLHVFL